MLLLATNCLQCNTIHKKSGNANSSFALPLFGLQTTLLLLELHLECNNIKVRHLGWFADNQTTLTLYPLNLLFATQ